MANTYFEFKQFTVHQDQCAMKVCTDACLFGAWVAEFIKENQVQHILDIGTGTGLLSLMLAQKCESNIDAVEIDEAAYNQAADNFNISPWRNRITAFHTALQEYTTTILYDVIISNPPFFEGDLKSTDTSKNKAKHDTTLTLEQLIQQVSHLLKPGGFFALLMPYQRLEASIREAEKNGLFLHEQVLVNQSVAHDAFRVMLIFGKENAGVANHSTITIKDAGQQYTPIFIALLKAYYLHL